MPSVKYGAAVLVLIPMLTVFGNSLVVVSVIHEKALRTVTNYFIVSLATSDVMVALLVMPLSIYGEVLEHVIVVIIRSNRLFFCLGLFNWCIYLSFYQLQDIFSQYGSQIHNVYHLKKIIEDTFFSNDP